MYKSNLFFNLMHLHVTKMWYKATCQDVFQIGKLYLNPPINLLQYSNIV